MAITTYSELKTTIASWLNRSDLTANITDFVTLAETRIHRDVASLNLVGLERRATATTTADDAYIGYPTGVLNIVSVKLNTSPVRVLRFMSRDEISSAYDGSSVSEPLAYTIIGDELKLAPTPDAAYTVEIIYTAKETVLSDANTTNWFLANTPDLLLQASMIEAEIFLKNDQGVQKWSTLYQASLASLESSNKSLRYPSAGLRVRPS